jgi:cephalosporin hydroxylase
MGELNVEKKAPDYGSTTDHDREIWQQVQDVIDQSGHSAADVLAQFPVYIRRVNLSRFLAHYELYKMIKDAPGHIVECGVYRGASLFSFAKFLEIFHAGDRARKVYGFDNFAGFTAIDEEDGKDNPEIQKVEGGWNAGLFYEELQKNVDIFHADSFVPWGKRIFLVPGDLSESAPKFVEENPGFRISLLHLDVDVYAPTLAALKAFYPCVVKGGLVVIDEYGTNSWPGESKAVEEYFGDKLPRLQKFNYQSLPGAFFIKE